MGSDIDKCLILYHTILHKEGHDVIGLSVTLQHTHYSVFLNIFNIILKCVIFGVLLPEPFFFYFIYKSQHFTSGYQCICILFDIAFNHAVP